MSIYTRGNTYYVDVRDGRGRRLRRRVGHSKATALMVEKDLLVKIARKEYLGIFEEDSTSFSEYAASWLERKKVTVSGSTYGDYASIMKVYALPHFGKIPLCKVTHRDVEDFLDGLRSLSAKRKNNIMVPVKCLFNDAKRRGDIQSNPTELIRRFKEEKPKIDPLSFPEMKAFLGNVDPHFVPYFTTAFLTGMRPNEMLALKWLHVDFEDHLEPFYFDACGFTPTNAGFDYSKRDVMIPMRDGVKLATDVFFPSTNGAFPVLLGRTTSAYIYIAFLIAAYLVVVLGVIFGILPPFTLLALLTLIFSVQIILLLGVLSDFAFKLFFLSAFSVAKFFTAGLRPGRRRTGGGLQGGCVPAGRCSNPGE